MATRLCYLLNAKGSENASINELKEKLEKPYDEDLGFGFSDAFILDASILSSVLIFSSTVKSKVFDTETNRLTVINRPIIQEVPFEINFTKSALIVQGGTDKIKRLLTILGVISKNKIAFEAIKVNIPKIVNLLSQKLTYFKLTGIIVTNFQPRPEVIGKFTARVSNATEADNLLREYQQDISEYTAEIELEGEELRLRMSSSGAIALGGTDETIQKGLILIIDTIRESNNA